MLTQQQFDNLANAEGNHLASIYIPTSPAGNTEKDRIRLKNAIQKAKNLLTERGMSDLDAKQYLVKGTNLTEDFDFAHDSGNGLAIFVNKSGLETVTLNQPTTERVEIGNSYLVSPLMGEIDAAENAFYLLTLSRGGTKLFISRDGQLDAIDTTGLVPEDMEAALLLDDPDAQLQRAGRSDRIGTFFGHGAGKDTEQGHLKAYFDIVDQGIATILKNETRPLLLAGVTELIPIYREANQYNHLIEDKYVSGNVDEMATTELYEKAQTALGDYFIEQKQRDLELFGLNRSKGEAGAEIEVIIPAAINGQLAVLWVAEGVTAYGKYKEESNTISLSTVKSDTDVELHNLALKKAKATGARIYLMPQENLPEPHSTICAIYRYAIPTPASLIG